MTLGVPVEPGAAHPQPDRSDHLGHGVCRDTSGCPRPGRRGRPRRPGPVGARPAGGSAPSRAGPNARGPRWRPPSSRRSTTGGARASCAGTPPAGRPTPRPCSDEEMGQLGGAGLELVPADGALAAVLVHEDHGGGVAALGGYLAQARPVGDPDLHRLRLGGHALRSSIAHGSRVRAADRPGRKGRPAVGAAASSAPRTAALPRPRTGIGRMVAQTVISVSTTRDC